MPIVKKQNADFHPDAQVSVADLAANDGASSSVKSPTGNSNNDNVEVTRAANGDVTQINVRCACGKVTSVACEY